MPALGSHEFQNIEPFVYEQFLYYDKAFGFSLYGDLLAFISFSLYSDF